VEWVFLTMGFSGVGDDRRLPAQPRDLGRRRRAFGYSSATWRLHLRGESIRSAQDVGWIRDLTIGRLMRTDVPKARFDMTIARFMEDSGAFH
jgi:hypothetical protein